MGACAQCQQNCPLIHGQRNADGLATSFFKWMAGNEFLCTLYLPPRFARSVTDYVDKKIYLEDCNGVQTEATVTNCNGELAIQEGWKQFSLEHNVERGDFVMFYWFKVPTEHFVVRVYGRSACEKTARTERSSKRARTINGLTDRDGTGNINLMNKENSISFAAIPVSGNSHHQAFEEACTGNSKRVGTINSLTERDDTGNINTMNKESSTRFAATPVVGNSHHQAPEEACTPIIDADDGGQQSTPSAMHLEEPFYMTDRDTGYSQEENRNHLYDLSTFEMPATMFGEGNNNSLKGKNGPVDLVQWDVQLEKDTISLNNNLVLPTKREANHSAGRTHVTREECPGTSHFDKKVKLQEKEPKQMGAKGVIPSIFETPASRPAERKSIVIGDREAILHVKSEVNSVKEKGPIERITPCKNKISPCKGSVPMTRAEWGGAFDIAEETRALKIEPMEIETEGKELNMTNKTCKAVKSEPADSADTSVPDAASKVSCLVLINHQDFLELPDCWPKKGRPGPERKVLYLKDPEGRVWPALYHRKKQFIVLTAGWKEFCAENQLKPEDECVFKAEKWPEYSVDIRRK